MPVPKRNYGGNQDYELLQAALLEQAMSQPGSGVFRPGRAPSNLAVNEFIASMPRGFEQGREAAAIEDMDARTRSAFDASTARQNKLDDFRAGATARDFETRRNVEEQIEQGPDVPVHAIRRFGMGEVTDPDAAASAGEKAMRDPRVIASGITAQGRVDAANAAAQQKIDEENRKRDAANAKIAKEESAAADTRKETARLAQEVLNHPALDRSVGPIDQWIPSFPSSGRDFEKKLNRLRDMISLEGRSKLGSGQGISNFEQKMLESALSALDQGGDEEIMRNELRRIIADAKRERPSAIVGGSGGGDAYDEYMRRGRK